MKLLAFDTSTEILHVAVQRGAPGHGTPLEHLGPGGAQASAALIPAVQRLLADAGLRLRELDAIVFGRGPGSFTGLRTACSVAQGLAFGASVPVLAVDTLLAVAEDARHRCGLQQLVAVLDARMDEVYWAGYHWDSGAWQRHGEIALGRPEAVVVAPGWGLAGNALNLYANRLPRPVMAFEAMPTAAALLRLAPALLAAGQGQPAASAMPLYIRDKVAQTTEERAQRRASPTATP